MVNNCAARGLASRNMTWSSAREYCVQAGHGQPSSTGRRSDPNSAADFTRRRPVPVSATPNRAVRVGYTQSNLLQGWGTGGGSDDEGVILAHG